MNPAKYVTILPEVKLRSEKLKSEAPIIAGMLRRNEKVKACSCLIPRFRDVAMVAPERDIPGMSAIA